MEDTTVCGKPDAESTGTDQVHIRLLGLGPRLLARARRDQCTVASIIRTAIVRLLESQHEPAQAAEPSDVPSDGRKVRVLLSFSPARARVLASRATACGMSRSRYVMALIDGARPPAQAADHGAMITALCRSTDQLAVLSRDLNALLRMLRQSRDPQVEPVCVQLHELIEVIHEHLFEASTLLAELKDPRREK